MSQILGRLQQINQISEQYQKAIVSARRFYEVLDAPATTPEVAGAPPLPARRADGGRGAVEFNFVTFGYDATKPVLRDIAFDVPAGSIVALVGPTGSGKSTLVQLLARFYDPQTGQIFIDGVDIRKAALKSVRGEIGFVFQETFLFSDTVANNIRYGKADADMGEVEAAARIAQAHEFILELPKGYDTMLGERGSTLSGGQRQRLAIARGILSNPRILVLDDALAAVDPETEHLISRALELVMVDRTVFIIAHRLSTVKAADLVIVLENGRITQAGNHAELMRQHGHYRHIAEVQLAYREKEIVAKAEKQADIAASKV
jgi:ATP-binding cassette subfamily B protein